MINRNSKAYKIGYVIGEFLSGAILALLVVGFIILIKFCIDIIL
jgi:hypothetical protein